MPKADRIFGLIGFPLSHSFSKKYFADKFAREGITACHYELFPLESIKDFPNLIADNKQLSGLNVTIPYKQQILPFLDDLSEDARSIGAVNVIQIKDGKLKGFNSDAYGFEWTLRGLLAKGISQNAKIQALILGTGGASLAVKFILEKLDIAYQYVSRSKKPATLTYDEITPELLEAHQLIINCTPLGTFPNVETHPQLPYSAISNHHFFYDLVYNPACTVFLKKAKEKGALVMNGLAMLHLQAEKSWEIWNQ